MRLRRGGRRGAPSGVGRTDGDEAAASEASSAASDERRLPARRAVVGAQRLWASARRLLTGLPLPLLAGLGLLLIGSGGVLISTVDEEQPAVERVGGNQPVNEGAVDETDLSANNSPSLARNPGDSRVLAVANRIDAPDFSCMLHVSRNAGRSWDLVKIPVPAGEEKCFAPDVAFGADGTLHVAFVTLEGNGNTPSAGWVSTLNDDGETLSEPRKALGPLSFQVRLTAHPSNPDRLYLTWLDVSDVALYSIVLPGNPIKAARSDDGGRTWSAGSRVSNSRRQRVLAPQPAIGPEGELYVLYLDVKDDRLDYEGLHDGGGGKPYDGSWELVLVRSEDGGETWSESVVEDRIVPPERFISFIPPFPSLAVDDDGRLYAAFDGLSGGDRDVLLWTLDPGDSDWGDPVRVNDTPADDETSQYLPKLSIAPDGRLDVLYYDRRADRANDTLTETSLQASFDRGESFAPRARLSERSFDSRVGFGSERGLPDLGSRLGLLSNDSRALAVWTDTRAGRPASGKQDISSGVVAVSGNDVRLGSGLRGALRFGGLALGLIGLALVGSTVMPRVRLGRFARRR